MTSTSKPALSDLHTRLDRLEARLSEIRTLDAIEHEGFDDALSQFTNRQRSIRSLIDETATETALSKADLETSDLEAGIERWIADVDRKFADGPPRISSVSM